MTDDTAHALVAELQTTAVDPSIRGGTIDRLLTRAATALSSALDERDDARARGDMFKKCFRQTEADLAALRAVIEQAKAYNDRLYEVDHARHGHSTDSAVQCPPDKSWRTREARDLDAILSSVPAGDTE